MNWRCARASALLATTLVSFRAGDGVILHADYAAGDPVAIMVHGVGAGRGEYEAFASTLQARGFGTLALDLRWHGRSDDVDWKLAVQDILAAARFVGKKKRLVLIGGSIGANLCSQALGSLANARALVLLSPGADYRGVGLSRFPPRTLAAASPQDAYSYATVQKLQGLVKIDVLEAKSGHGAQMLGDPDFAKALADWLDQHRSGS
jgi:pimeloyl-ACP methyl ester carboxylesterase